MYVEYVLTERYCFVFWLVFIPDLEKVIFTSSRIKCYHRVSKMAAACDFPLKELSLLLVRVVVAAAVEDDLNVAVGRLRRRRRRRRVRKWNLLAGSGIGWSITIGRRRFRNGERHRRDVSTVGGVRGDHGKRRFRMMTTERLRMTNVGQVGVQRKLSGLRRHRIVRRWMRIMVMVVEAAVVIHGSCCCCQMIQLRSGVEARQLLQSHP